MVSKYFHCTYYTSMKEHMLYIKNPSICIISQNITSSVEFSPDSLPMACGYYSCQMLSSTIFIFW
jgi:hypothetical protein